MSFLKFFLSTALTWLPSRKQNCEHKREWHHTLAAAVALLEWQPISPHKHSCSWAQNPAAVKELCAFPEASIISVTPYTIALMLPTSIWMNSSEASYCLNILPMVHPPSKKGIHPFKGNICQSRFSYTSFMLILFCFILNLILQTLLTVKHNLKIKKCT